MSLGIRHAVGLMAIAHHSTAGMAPWRLPSFAANGCSQMCMSSMILQQGRPSWVTAAKSRKNRRQQVQEDVDLDSTTELMGELDIDALLNDEEAMNTLRSKLLSEMASAHGQTTVKLAAKSPHNSRVFDSDEYDLEALDTTDPQTESIDEIAQEAAHKLASDSQDIAEHLIADHQHDHMMDSMDPPQQQQQQWRLQQQQQQQQQQGLHQDRSKSTSSQEDQQQQSKSGSGSSSKRGGKNAAHLAGDSAIGRVAQSKPGTAVVVLKRGKARLFESGSPMVYSGAVDCIIGRPPPAAGDAVVLADHNMMPIAWGVYNPVSMFRVRIMQMESEALADDSAVLDIPSLLNLRISQALALRATLGLPSEVTNVVRLINSEGDRMSGVIADMLGDTIVLQSCAAWSERYRSEITRTLQHHTGRKQIMWRPASGILKEEGIDISAETPSSTSETASPLSSQSEDSTPHSTSHRAELEHERECYQEDRRHSNSSASSSSSRSWLDNAVRIKEAGLTFLADPSGQKTGFYADQRHNRSFIASLAAGKTVLDLCCYSGGFGLMAAAAGAAAVTGVDSSAAAVELAAANARLNGLQDRCAFVRDDVSTFLRAALEAGEAFDIVILDPPKLAPNKSTLGRASHKYKKLNALALGVVRSGGILMTCSCSGAMTQSGGLSKVVQEAAAEADRQVTLLSKAGAAPDHPLHPAYPEGEYLTALTYRVI